MEITGTLIKIFPTVQISDSFQKREFVIRVEDRYPQEVILQATQDYCSRLDEVAEGEEVTVKFNLRGRKWQKDANSDPRWFNTLQAWKIDAATNAADAPQIVNATEVNNDVPF